MRGQDLFPRDFIYSLAPPTNYIGAENIFGDEPRFSDALEEIYPQEMDSRKFFPIFRCRGNNLEILPNNML